jgi:hypothetical protein
VHPLLILLVLLALIFTVRWVKEQPAEKRHQAGFLATLIAASLVILVALATGKLTPLIAAVAAGIPMLQRLSHAKSFIDRFRTSRSSSGSGNPVVSTAYLRIGINRNNGEWTGKVLQGAHKNQPLSALSFEQLSNLLKEFEHQDPESAALLTGYIDRYGTERQQDRGSRQAATATMSRPEASKVLGLDESATAEEIVAAHRRLMQKLHPDRGGTDYLASKINQAKDCLLSRR